MVIHVKCANRVLMFQVDEFLVVLEIKSILQFEHSFVLFHLIEPGIKLRTK